MTIASKPASAAAPGVLDPTFGSNGTVTNAAGLGANGMAVLGNGDSVVSYTTSNGVFQVSLVSPQGSFLKSTSVVAGAAQAVAVVPSGAPVGAGNIVAVGYELDNSCQRPFVAEFTPSLGLVWYTGNGSVAKLPCGVGAASFYGVAVDPSSGKIVAAGSDVANPTPQTLVARLVPSGALDPSFGNAGEYVHAIGGGSEATGVAISPDGDVIVSGHNTDANKAHMTVLALDNSGAPDTAFAGTGLYELPLDTSGNQSFGEGVAVVPSTVTSPPAPPAGTIFAVGKYSPTVGVLISLSPTGALNWPAPVTAAGQFTSVTYQPSGNTVTAGGSVGNAPNQSMLAAQYNATSGAANPYFGSNGVTQIGFPGPAFLSAVSALGNGEVLGAGEAPGASSGVTVIGMALIQGATVTITSPPLQQTTSTGPYTVDYTLTMNEPLYSPVSVYVCGPSGSDVNNSGQQCAVATIPAGSTQLSVPVTINVTYTAGNQQQVPVGVQTINGGVAASPAQAISVTVVQHIPPPPPITGYRMVAADGGVFSFKSPFEGSTGGIHLAQPIVGMASTPSGKGYWLVARDGGIFAFGDAHYHGSTGGIPLNQPIVGMAATPDGGGYWLVARDGGIFAFGDARFHGSTGAIRLNQPIVGMAATPDGGGYWLVASDGGIFSFGDARFMGSTGGIRLAQPIVGMAADPGAPGYWMVASDGGIFAFGAAGFHGSTGGVHLDRPIVGMTATSDGQGYWMVASDGGIFAFGDAKFFGSTGGIPLVSPIVGMSQ